MTDRPTKKAKAPPAAPNEAILHEAALEYLAARAASVAQMKRVLARKIDNWGRRATRAGVDAEAVESDAARARQHIEDVLARLRRSGLIDDAKFARQRAGSLNRAGKSSRAIAFDLAQRGVSREIVRESVASDGASDLLAAVTLTRKKRLGPFARSSDESPTRETKRKWLGALARAGFSMSVAERALRMDREAAEELLRSSKPLGW